MSSAVVVFLPLFAAIMLGCGLLPSSLVNSQTQRFRRFVTCVVGLQFLLAVGFLLGNMTGWLPTSHFVLVRFSLQPPIEISVYYDGVASLMFALVSFVGWVICLYSIRYLDGESAQGRYFRWTSVTIGAVSMMVISGNLLMFVAMWIVTSLGLHRLLLHYAHRPAAQRAAWTKFVISRIGDVALIAAMVLIYNEFNTFDFAKLFAAAGSLATVTPAMHAAGFLLVAGAVTKSAQFPFHTWLPLTMETPTPVSALMHAGIVNAGGYLIIRTSQLEALTPWALTTLAVLGGFTACFAATVMLTQTSVKKALAYSTIAQMGFMLLQCGLGAYSSAMLHILAHSLYKAYAFLSSGSVVASRAADFREPSLNRPLHLIPLAIVAPILFAWLWLSLTLFGIDLTAKPGGLLLGGLLCLALTHWIGQAMRTDSRTLALRTIAISACLCLAYSASFFAIDSMVSPSLPTPTAPALMWLIVALVASGFAGMFLLQWSLSNGRTRETVHRLRIHASNGFYLESAFRRVLEPITKNESTPGIH